MSDVPRLLALVPARGGSQGLPRKNARTLGSRPLLGWTADAIRASGVTATAVLSTDDEELAEIGRSVGLEVPFMRPAELANATASALAVVEHALEWFAARGQEFDLVAYLQPTSPFRPATALSDAIERLRDSSVPGVIGVMKIDRSPSVLFYADEIGRLSPLSQTQPVQTRRQDVRALLTPNGALYVTRTSVIRAERTLFPAGTVGMPMNQIASLDIDDATDWALAEAIVAAGLA